MAKPESSVSISPNNRSSCLYCGCGINKGTPRVSHFSRSEWHDGFDRRYVHLGCGSQYKTNASNTGALKYLRLPRYSHVCEAIEELSITLKPEDVFSEKERLFNDIIWELKDELEEKMKPDSIKNAVELCGLTFDERRPDLAVHLLADALLHGKQPPCPSCKKVALINYGERSECSGYISAVTKCPYETNNALSREILVLPASLRSEPYFITFKPSAMVQFEAFPGGPRMDPSVPSEDEAEVDVPKGEEMMGMTFAFCGTVGDRKAITAKIQAHGGMVASDVDAATHIISSEAETTKKKPLVSMKKIKNKGYPVLPVEFIDELANRNLLLRQRKHMKTMLLCGNEGSKIPPVAALRLAASLAGNSKSAKRKAASGEEDEEDNATAGGGADANDTAAANAGSRGGSADKSQKKPRIAPNSQLLKVDQFFDVPDCTIYVDDNNTAHNVALTSTDIKTGVNKFYLIQLLQKTKSSYYLFTRWGRVGDDSGINYFGYGYGMKESFQKKRFGSAASAIAAFAEKFKKCTGNDWYKVMVNVSAFKHEPGRYNYIELDGQDGSEDTTANGEKGTAALDPAVSNGPKLQSSLEPHVQSFVKLIFDQDMMRKHMAEENIDLKRMPLGSLSKRQMEAGYHVLKEILDILRGETAVLDDKHRDVLLLDATNRFYSVIPHVFTGVPPVIRTMDNLKRKLDLMEQLMEISVANKLLKESENTASDINQVDAQYTSLNCNLAYIDPSTPTYAMIAEYMKNTHAATHSEYKLKIRNIFAVSREGEAERFQPFANMHNRQLLWHGSRITNWVGILSQGLRIAPPEAPVTGYMFGKGVYLADMVSKSANYCFASRANPTGILLLCESALGDMYERLASEYNAGESCKAAKKHSTWGIGKTTPDPSDSMVWGNGVVVPKGKGVPSKQGDASSLLYDEFIVYDVSQIAIRFVIETQFVY